MLKVIGLIGSFLLGFIGLLMAVATLLVLYHGPNQVIVRNDSPEAVKDLTVLVHDGDGLVVDRLHQRLLKPKESTRVRHHSATISVKLRFATTGRTFSESIEKLRLLRGEGLELVIHSGERVHRGDGVIWPLGAFLFSYSPILLLWALLLLISGIVGVVLTRRWTSRRPS